MRTRFSAGSRHGLFGCRRWVWSARAAAVCLLSAVALGDGGGAWAETLLASAEPEPIAITVEQAVERALTANHELRIDRLQLAGERRSAETAWNRFLPSLSASSSLSRSVPGRADDPYSVSAGVQSSLSLSVARVREGRRAMLEYQQGQVSYEESEQRLRRDVRRAYYAILVHEAELKIKNEAVDTAEVRYRRSVDDYEAGLVSRYTMLSDRVAWQRQVPELGALEDDVRAAKAEFAMLLGFSRETRIELTDELSVETIELDAERLVTLYRDVSPHIRTEMLRAEEDELALRLERDRDLPSLSLSYSVSQTHGTPFTDPWADSDSWSTSGQVSISLSLSLDRLLPGSAARTAKEDRERSLAERELRLLDLRERADEEIEQLVRRIERTQESLEVRALTAETAELAYELAEEEYEDGFIDSLELRSAALELEEARLAVLEEQLRLLNAYAELEYMLGDRGKEL